MKFSVTVTLKKDVLDPQGKVVQNTLQNLGMDNLKSIRQGKYFEIELNENNQNDAEKVKKAINKVLRLQKDIDFTTEIQKITTDIIGVNAIAAANKTNLY